MEESSTCDKSDAKFKCSICLDLPVDPVVTTCGHMYCWLCLYYWLNRGTMQCPVCKSGVKRETIIPIYGVGAESKSSQQADSKEYVHPMVKYFENGDDVNESNEPKFSSERPRAHRTEPTTTNRNNGGTTLQFGFFPFGMGIQFTSFSSFSSEPQRPLTTEEQRSQTMSSILIFIGVAIMFWAVFVDTSS